MGEWSGWEGGGRTSGRNCGGKVGEVGGEAVGNAEGRWGRFERQGVRKQAEVE